MDVTIILVLELQPRFPNNEIMNAMGMMYPQYWLDKDNYDVFFVIHLGLIKYAFYSGKKTKARSFIPHG